jgi:hypothetical protein
LDADHQDLTDFRHSAATSNAQLLKLARMISDQNEFEILADAAN